MAVPDAGALGLPRPDWELRYFALSSDGGLRVYESDRDEGRGEPAGLLHLAGCAVEVEPPGAERAESGGRVAAAPHAGGLPPILVHPSRCPFVVGRAYRVSGGLCRSPHANCAGVRSGGNG